MCYCRSSLWDHSIKNMMGWFAKSCKVNIYASVYVGVPLCRVGSLSYLLQLLDNPGYNGFSSLIRFIAAEVLCWCQDMLHFVDQVRQRQEHA